MPQIIQLSQHIANLIAAGEVVERPASVAKELLENAVDAGASKITIEIRDGGMTFLRVTDNGCGMGNEDARTAFLRHATSKLRTAEDLASIATMGFRGEALAAIASVSRIDLLTKTTDSLTGTSIHLEAGVITEESEAGCPNGTTIIVRDLFYNTPARMKFMKSDTVESGRVAAAVQLQALAHPEVAFTFLRDGKQLLSTPGSGKLQDAVYCVYGRECTQMAAVESRWENYHICGFVSKPTDARPSRSLQTFFVNDRPVQSKLLIRALEEAYRNQIMTGKFPACVLHLRLPVDSVDVNVHPAKTEVKFLQEKAVFDCVHYGVLAALNKQSDRPQVQFKSQPAPTSQTSGFTGSAVGQQSDRSAPSAGVPKQETFFRTMTAAEYKNFTSVISAPPQPKPEAAKATAAAVEQQMHTPLRQTVITPAVTAPASASVPVSSAVSIPQQEEPVQQAIAMPQEAPWRMVGQLYNSYIIVEQGDDAFLIDKHAAHERILFEKLKAHQEAIRAQLLANSVLLNSLGFEIDEFGDNTVLLRQIPMDLSPDAASETLETIASDLLSGRRESADTMRDHLLHTVACKAAIKAGWNSDEKELEVLVRQVMADESLKYCPHGRPICISLSKKQLEKQFKRS